MLQRDDFETIFIFIFQLFVYLFVYFCLDLYKHPLYVCIPNKFLCLQNKPFKETFCYQMTPNMIFQNHEIALKSKLAQNANLQLLHFNFSILWCLSEWHFHFKHKIFCLVLECSKQIPRSLKYHSGQRKKCLIICGVCYKIPTP